MTVFKGLSAINVQVPQDTTRTSQIKLRISKLPRKLFRAKIPKIFREEIEKEKRKNNEEEEKRR